MRFPTMWHFDSDEPVQPPLVLVTPTDVWSVA